MLGTASSSGTTLTQLNKPYDDLDVWGRIPKKHLWAIDKLVLAARLGYVCGPKGVPVPKAGWYVVRPCVNMLGMGRGAKLIRAKRGEEIEMPEGFFWCERFTGEHLSVDYENGLRVLTVEGIGKTVISNSKSTKLISHNLDRWNMWRRVRKPVKLPRIVDSLRQTCQYLNIEMVGGRVIEVHFRLNPDFRWHNSDYVKPIYFGEIVELEEHETFVADAEGDRLGFIIEKD